MGFKTFYEAYGTKRHAIKSAIGNTARAIARPFRRARVIAKAIRAYDSKEIADEKKKSH